MAAGNRYGGSSRVVEVDGEVGDGGRGVGGGGHEEGVDIG